MKNMNLCKHSSVWFMSAVIAVVLLSTLAVTQLGAQVEDGSIYACRHEKTGVIIIPINDSCPGGWEPLSWSIQGSKGDQGVQGPRGSAGEKGEKGDPGTSRWSDGTGNDGSEQVGTMAKVGIGTLSPEWKLEVNSFKYPEEGILSTDDNRAIVGRLGDLSCPGHPYAVGGCAWDSNQTGVMGSSGYGTAIKAMTENGNLFVGQTQGYNKVRIDAAGQGYFDGGTTQGGADFAESMLTADELGNLAPGDVLVMDPQNPLAVKKSEQANSQLVVGVYSTKPAVLATGDHHIDDALEREVPVAVVGIVPTKATAENGPIHVGDLLVTSSVPGHAMKAQPVVINGTEIYPTGVILGKALESLEKGAGIIKILVMLR